MLQIHIGSITDIGWLMDEQVEAQKLALIADICQDGATAFTQPLHVRLRAALAGESVQLEGRVQTTVRLTCSRCLEPFEFDIDTSFTATAIAEDPALSKDNLTGDVELSADEMDVIPYVGENIDLRQEIAQQVIMALPFKPLCRDACKGLCSRCGVNLNHGSCQCDPLDQSSPFAVLKTLRLPPEKD